MRASKSRFDYSRRLSSISSAPANRLCLVKNEFLPTCEAVTGRRPYCCETTRRACLQSAAVESVLVAPHVCYACQRAAPREQAAAAVTIRASSFARSGSSAKTRAQRARICSTLFPTALCASAFCFRRRCTRSSRSVSIAPTWRRRPAASAGASPSNTGSSAKSRVLLAACNWSTMCNRAVVLEKHRILPQNLLFFFHK